MNYRSCPAWLYALLTVLLLLLFALLWLGRDGGKQESVKSDVKTAGVKMPEVVFEDSERMASVKVAESKEKVKKPALVERHGIALILDDVGYDLPALRRALAFPWPLTIAILPDAPHARKAAVLAHEAGHPVMLHMPMEPLSQHYRDQMDASFLRVGMGRDKVRELMRDALTRVPFVEGVNNHMGSRLTALEEPMRWVMQVCSEQKLFFVDSRTSNDSVAARMARESGLRWGTRRVFLDDSIESEKLAASWRLARARLAKTGSVIVIVHPHKESLDFLAHLGAAEQAVIVPLKRLLRVAGEPAVTAHSGDSRQ